MTQIAKDKRKHTRFQPDLDSIALIDLNGDHKLNEFTLSLNALIFNESFSGCGLVAIYNEQLIKGKKVIAKVGQLEPSYCEIKWINKIDEKVVMLGVEYQK